MRVRASVHGACTCVYEDEGGQKGQKDRREGVRECGRERKVIGEERGGGQDGWKEANR